jgi:hypothetical protein
MDWLLRPERVGWGAGTRTGVPVRLVEGSGNKTVVMEESASRRDVPTRVGVGDDGTDAALAVPAGAGGHTTAIWKCFVT